MRAHLPDKLTITLWDFSWYTRAAAGEPFGDLDRAMAEAVQRGYNTVRICGMPFLLFGSGMDTSALSFGPLGGGYGQRTRWYDVSTAARVDGRAHLLELFRAAQRHDCFVILSTWEYQQSPAFLADRRWFDALMAVEPESRATTMAETLADTVDFLTEEGADDRIAFVELHNEVQLGRLAEGLPTDEPPVVALRPRLERAIDRFKHRHPNHLMTVNYAEVPVAEMRGLPANIDLGVFHPYVYGVLDELIDTFALRDSTRPFPQERAQVELLRPGAPALPDWMPPAAESWRVEATIVGQREIYVHDWCDPARWDRWLYDRYALHRPAMEQRLRLWLEVAADRCAEAGIPLVFGEGWIGYTPVAAGFEEGPAGAAFCELAVDHAARVGAWGTVVCSNAAPHHPMWSDIALQRSCNESFLRHR